jgi:hypothetical protein
MKKIVLYTDTGIKTVEFEFNEPVVRYDNLNKWVSVGAANRTIILSGTNFLGYDEDIPRTPAGLDFGGLWQQKANEVYVKSEKILVIFSASQEPLNMFHGATLTMEREGEMYHFKVDDKDIWVYGLNFLVLNKNG